MTPQRERALLRHAAAELRADKAYMRARNDLYLAIQAAGLLDLWTHPPTHERLADGPR